MAITRYTESFTTRIKTSLNKTLPPVQTIDGVMFAKDSCANEIIVELYKDGEKVVIPQLNHATVAFVTIVDEDTSTSYEIPGEITSDGNAVVVIPANSAYAKECVLLITIRLYGDKDSDDNWRYAAVIAAFKCKITNAILANTQTVIPAPVADMTAYLSEIQGMIDYLDGQIRDVANMESSYADAELAREKAEKGPNLDGNGGRVKAEADRVAAENLREEDFNKIRNMTVDAHSVQYGAQPTAVMTDRPATVIDGVSHPNRKHIEFGLVPGIGVSNMHLTEDYKLYVGYSDGNTYTTPDSIRGPRGETAFGMVVESYDSTNEKLTLNNTANNSHVFDDDSISPQEILDIFTDREGGILAYEN